MRRLILSFAALAALVVALPYAAPAKADPVVVVGPHRHHDWRLYDFHHHDHDRDRTVTIKHQ